jgi:DNA-binding NarL/FixJ family response regulator
MNIANQISVIIADNQFLITESLNTILEKDGNFKVRKVVTNKHDLTKAIKSEKISLLIIDIALIDFNSFSELVEIKNEFPNIHLLVLTNSLSKNELLELNAAGIKNIIYKTADEAELFDAINASLKGKKYYSAELLDMLFEATEKKANMDETSQLTGTEIEVVRLIAEGLTTKDIAARKHISFHTVISHRKNIFRKLHVSSASELIMYAIKAGWIDNIEYFI